jgi:predicted AlkP superfamily phosphohydrolase/phosphomutase
VGQRAGAAGGTVLAVVALFRLGFVASAALAVVPPAEAYIGPGAGFALATSLLAVISTLLLATFILLTWPIRWLLGRSRRRRRGNRRRVGRVVIVGLDGLDAELTERFMAEGMLPNLARLRARGTYTRLATTLPAESPVAWSSFQTGCNPGRHRIFDFLVPDRKTYQPTLCSAQIRPAARHVSLGPYRVPLGRPSVRFERKSRAFWTVLGEHGVFSTILRVPVSFPPEPFQGLCLAAMSVPDLRGTQGTFSYHASGPAGQAHLAEGLRVPVEANGSTFHSYLVGPPNPMRRDGRELRIPFQVRVASDGTSAELHLGRGRHTLRLRQYTPWIHVRFRAGLGVRISGICRFYPVALAPHLELYVSPINIDPARPALPLSSPPAYAVYLARTQGPFATLGLAEDTWALNEGVLDEQAFLEQAYDVHAEREHMLFDALAKTRRGCVVCVFDISDRVQHMFWRYLDPGHPANRGKDAHRNRDAIRLLYQRLDDLVGRVMGRLDDDTVLFVMSDHGCKPFSRSVNLNAWLHRHGYLSLEPDTPSGDWFKGVDWTRTRAYAVGMGGIYLNLAGREAGGIVGPGEEATRLKTAIASGLRSLRDPERDTHPVREVYDTREAYRGPYVDEAPDLIVGLAPGYRASWKCATGTVVEDVLTDNTKSWSGDHCVNPPDVPGVLFCTRPIAAEGAHIMDIAPTVLDLFGVPVPTYVDGKSLLAMPATAKS